MTREAIINMFDGRMITQSEKSMILDSTEVLGIVYYKPSELFEKNDLYLIIFNNHTFCTCYMKID